MPSLVRFLSALAILAALAVGSVLVLATQPAPNPREMIVTIPPEQFAKVNDGVGASSHSRRLMPLETQKPDRLAGVLETLRFDR